MKRAIMAARTGIWASLAMAAALGASAGTSLAETAVYSNLPGIDRSSMTGVDGVWRGDEVTLAGTVRELTRLEIPLISGDGTTDLLARIYLNDGSDGKPGTVLWDSGLLDDVPLSDGYNLVSIDIPNVTVPDTITWAYVLTDQQTTTAINSKFYDPPSIGSSSPDFYWWNSGVSGWVQNEHFGHANLGGAIYAVPEPATLGFFAAGACLVLRRRRRA
ncbi:MAG: hypothetical protein AMJ81_01335 [Phycisphaerae bacterium SM23_33]|nr:MAG: hypothetical protein AMJ81_01335 [Phycisphaerae bacterium SM23_33]